MIMLDNVYKELKNNDLRVNIDNRSEKWELKIRLAEINKIPIMIIIGKKKFLIKLYQLEESLKVIWVH